MLERFVELLGFGFHTAVVDLGFVWNTFLCDAF